MALFIASPASAFKYPTEYYLTNDDYNGYDGIQNGLTNKKQQSGSKP
jgi:hypothetical protein